MTKHKIADYHIDKINFDLVISKRLSKTAKVETKEHITINSSDLSDETLSAVFKDIDKRLEFKAWTDLPGTY